MAAPAALSFASTTGPEAIKIVNRWLTTKELANSWYSEEHKGVFLKDRYWTNKLFRNKYIRPEIAYIFTVQKDDWDLVINTSLPTAHTWYRRRKDKGGECSWLPLYGAAEQPLGRERICQKVEAASGNLAIVSNLPAARLDLWGMVVMAYANGAWGQIADTRDGGFKATLYANNFVLSIKQENVKAPTVGHLEPREHPTSDREPLDSDARTCLLTHGHSLPRDWSLGWPIRDNLKKSESLARLVNGELNEDLRKVVLDNFESWKLRKSLRISILSYRRKLIEFAAWLKHGFLDVTIRDIPFELFRLEKRISSAKGLHINRMDYGQPRPANFIAADINTTSGIQQTEQPFPGEWGRNIERLTNLIDASLWRIKLLFYDENINLVDNLNRDDVLELFREEMRLLELFSSHHDEANTQMERTAEAAAEEVKSLFYEHNVVMAKALIIRHCETIHVRLSVRNTGHDILLS